jgi:hypothetical protein
MASLFNARLNQAAAHVRLIIRNLPAVMLLHEGLFRTFKTSELLRNSAMYIPKHRFVNHPTQWHNTYLYPIIQHP